MNKSLTWGDATNDINFLKSNKNLINSSYYKLISKLIKVKQNLSNKIPVRGCDKFFSGTHDLAHGDFYNENMIFNADNEIILLDLEEMHYGHRAEDLLNFVLFACCNTGFEKENINNAKIFLSSYFKKSPISKEDVRLGFYCSFRKLSNSFFLEKEFFRTQNNNLLPLIERDIRKFLYFQRNLENFVKDLIE